MILLSVDGTAVESTAAVVRAGLPVEQQLVVARDWTEFLAGAARSGCLLLAAPILTADVARRVRQVRRLHPFHPIVLMTEFQPDNARRLVGLPVDEVVWWDLRARELATIVGSARAASLLERVAAEVEAAPCLSPLLRRAMSTALRMVPPPCSVEQLAAISGCHRSTLGEQWADCAGRHVRGIRLQDFTAWLVLLHAAGRKPAHVKWDVVAAECGVHLHTLRRASLRLAGLRLAQIEGEGRGALLAAFAERVLRPLGIVTDFGAAGVRTV